MSHGGYVSCWLQDDKILLSQDTVVVTRKAEDGTVDGNLRSVKSQNVTYIKTKCVKIKHIKLPKIKKNIILKIHSDPLDLT